MEWMRKPWGSVPMAHAMDAARMASNSLRSPMFSAAGTAAACATGTLAFSWAAGAALLFLTITALIIFVSKIKQMSPMKTVAMPSTSTNHGLMFCMIVFLPS